MKRMLIFLASGILAALLLAACSMTSENAQDETGGTPDSILTSTSENSGTSVQASSANVKMIKLKLYFPSSDNGSVIAEEHEVQVKDGAIMRAAIDSLINGPSSDELRKPLPEGTRLFGIKGKEILQLLTFQRHIPVQTV